MEEFENYKGKKGFWFWIMLTVGSVISADEKLSARHSNDLAEEFIASNFYRKWFDEDKKETRIRRHVR